MDYNEIETTDSIQVINAKLKTEKYAEYTDEEIKEMLEGIVDFNVFTVKNGQLLNMLEQEK